MSKHKKFDKESQNPQGKIADVKTYDFEKESGRKVDHDTLNSHSRSEILDQRDKNRPRDSI